MCIRDSFQSRHQIADDKACESSEDLVVAVDGHDAVHPMMVVHLFIGEQGDIKHQEAGGRPADDGSRNAVESGPCGRHQACNTWSVREEDG